MKWLKLPFFPIVTAKASNVPKPRGTCTVHIHVFLHERLPVTLSLIYNN